MIKKLAVGLLAAVVSAGAFAACPGVAFNFVSQLPGGCGIDTCDSSNDYQTSQRLARYSGGNTYYGFVFWKKQSIVGQPNCVPYVVSAPNANDWAYWTTAMLLAWQNAPTYSRDTFSGAQIAAVCSETQGSQINLNGTLWTVDTVAYYSYTPDDGDGV